MDRITKRVWFPSSSERKVWKIFAVGIDGRPRGAFQADPVQTDKWIEAAVNKVLLSDYYRRPRKYKSGFHCFEKEEDAVYYCESICLPGDYRVVEIRVKGIRYFGTDKNYPILIARQMYLDSTKFVNARTFAVKTRYYEW